LFAIETDSFAELFGQSFVLDVVEEEVGTGDESVPVGL
jgi:hypothetical protein